MLRGNFVCSSDIQRCTYFVHPLLDVPSTSTNVHPDMDVQWTYSGDPSLTLYVPLFLDVPQTSVVGWDPELHPDTQNVCYVL